MKLQVAASVEVLLDEAQPSVSLRQVLGVAFKKL